MREIALLALEKVSIYDIYSDSGLPEIAQGRMSVGVA